MTPTNAVGAVLNTPVHVAAAMVRFAGAILRGGQS
jgi:hypothetical protein